MTKDVCAFDFVFFGVSLCGYVWTVSHPRRAAYGPGLVGVFIFYFLSDTIGAIVWW